MAIRRMSTAVGDLSRHFYAATRGRPQWTRDRARSLAESVTASLPNAQLDWDEDAGEDWARVVVDQWVVALVRIPIPLLLVLRAEARDLSAMDPEVVVVPLDDMDSPDLRASTECILDAFPEREPSPTLNPGAFSAMDLWYATT